MLCTNCDYNKKFEDGSFSCQDDVDFVNKEGEQVCRFQEDAIPMAVWLNKDLLKELDDTKKALEIKGLEVEHLFREIERLEIENKMMRRCGNCSYGLDGGPDSDGEQEYIHNQCNSCMRTQSQDGYRPSSMINWKKCGTI